MYDENNPEPRTEPDTHNATTIRYRDMLNEGKRMDNSRSFYRFYEVLSLTNTGRWNGKWHNENHERLIENLAMYDSIASQLYLTDRQKGIGRSRFPIPDFRKYSQLGGVRMAAFCMCALVCAEDGRKYYPTMKPEDNDPEFVRMAEELGLKQDYIAKAIEKLRSELKPYRSGHKSRQTNMSHRYL
mgnify:FL=1